MNRFSDEYDKMIIQTGSGLMDHIATIEEIVNGYIGGHSLQTEAGLVDFTGEAARDLFERIGLPVKVLHEFEQHPELQKQMALAKLADSGRGKDMLIARGVSKHGKTETPIYQAFLDSNRLPVLNSQVLTGLREHLPETALIHRANIYDRRMMLRIVEESWYHDLGPGGRAYTAMVIENDEKGLGGLRIRTGVAVVSCFNYTLSHQLVFEHTSGFLAPQKLAAGIGEAVARLDAVSTTVADQLRGFQNVQVNDVQAMLRLMAGEQGLPEYVVKESEQWWQGAGAVPTLYMVVQALAFGVDKMTTGKNPQWERRAMAETHMVDMAQEFSETGEMKFHQCPKCHRPMNVYDGSDTVDAEYVVS